MKSEKRNRVVEIRRTFRGIVPNVPFENIARSILGARYDLSLVLCGDALARKMNRNYRLPSLKLRRARKKNYAPNVLSFSLGKNEGEIFLNVQTARREAKKYDVALRARFVLLFAHGCLHLAGLRHGKRMDSEVSKYLRRFG